MGYVMDRVCDGWRLSQAEGVTEVWLFGEDSFEECPLTLAVCSQHNLVDHQSKHV